MSCHPIDFEKYAKGLGGLAIAIVPYDSGWHVWGKSNNGVICNSSINGVNIDDDDFANKVADTAKGVIKNIIKYNTMTRDQLVDEFGEELVDIMEKQGETE